MGIDYVRDAYLRITPMKRVMYKDTLHESHAFLGSRAPRRLPILENCQHSPNNWCMKFKRQPYRTEVATLRAYGA
jgi:hypothetical protein